MYGTVVTVACVPCTMEQLLVKLADLGAIGIVAAIMIYDVFYLQRKLIQIIENNTKAMTSLRDHCSRHVPYGTEPSDGTA